MSFQACFLTSCLGALSEVELSRNRTLPRSSWVLHLASNGQVEPGVMSTRALASEGFLPSLSLMHGDSRVAEPAPTAPSSGGQTDSPEAAEKQPTSNNRPLSEILSNINEDFRSSDRRLAIMSLSRRNPIPLPVLGLRPLDSHATCYRKLYYHLIYLRQWLREPKHRTLFSEKDVREFHRQAGQLFAHSVFFFTLSWSQLGSLPYSKKEP